MARSSIKSQSNYQIILHFVRTNMQLFIRLISTDIHNNEVALTANEFNSLRILFKIKPNSLIQNNALTEGLKGGILCEAKHGKVQGNTVWD